MSEPASLFVGPDVLLILGKTEAELLDMGLREFAELSFSKGIVWEIGDDGVAPGLTIRIERHSTHAAGDTP